MVKLSTQLTLQHLAIVITGDSEDVMSFERLTTFLAWFQKKGLKELTLIPFQAFFGGDDQVCLDRLQLVQERFQGHWNIRLFGEQGCWSQNLQMFSQSLPEHEGAPTLWLGHAYSSYQELIQAFQQLFPKVPCSEWNEEVVNEHLQTAFLHDPEAVIYIGGEQRLPNALLWQFSYAELLFLQKKLIDCQVDDFEQAFCELACREKRFGR